MRRLVALALLALVVGGCAPSILGGGSEAQMQQLNADFRRCRDESEWAHFIPDFGATRDINHRDCSTVSAIASNAAGAWA